MGSVNILRKNRDCSYKDWLKIAEYHINTYEEPSLEEGFSEVIFY